MQEIKCPNCGEVIQVDESDYAQILQQVRDKEFEKELTRRAQELEQKQETVLQMQRLQQEQEQLNALSRKDAAIADKDRQIAALQARLDSARTETKLAVAEAVRESERQLAEKTAAILQLEGKLSSKDTESQLREKSLTEQYESKLKLKDEQIEYYKDFKARQSTKMVGESLEQHCMNQFNSLRMTAFPNAYFEKDNDAKSGSKGDFIFRESADGTEF